MTTMHNHKVYPPRFTIEVNGQRATARSVVEVEFTGVNKPLCSEVILLLPPEHKEIPGIVCNTLPVMYMYCKKGFVILTVVFLIRIATVDMVL